jgi:hypothetical protein
MGGAAGMAEKAGSVDSEDSEDSEGVVVSDAGAGGVAAGWVDGDSSVDACGGAIVAARVGVARTETGAGSGGRFKGGQKW